jgi:large subunit ribosomal protein L19e
MSDLRNQRRVAAAVLGCGEGRVWIDPLHADAVAEAVTRQDIRGLVKKGYIRAQQKAGTSRGRARALKIQKDSGRRKGPGSRKGATGARSPRKQRWMRVIRPLRASLKEMRDSGKVTPTIYRQYYLKAKGGVFRSRAHLVSHMRTDGVLKEE